MAELNVLIKATNQASGPIRDVESDLGRLEKTAGQTLGSFGEGLKDVGGKLTTFVSLPLIALGGTALKFSVDFNAAMANVASLGLLPERVLELKGNVQEMAVEFGQSTKDLSGGLYQVVSAFGDSSDSAELLEINAKSAAAGLATVSDSVALTSAVTKGYGDTSKEAVAKVADLAFQTVKLGQTTFPELAGAMGAVVPLASTLGVETETLFAQMATLTGVTGNAAEVSTQLRATYQAMLKPTGEMATAFAGVVTQLDAQGKLAGGPLVDAWKNAQLQFQSNSDYLAVLKAQLSGTNTESEAGAKAAKNLENAISEQEKTLKENKKTLLEAAAALGGSIVQSVGFTDALGLLTETAGGNTDTLGKMFGSVESLNAVLALTGAQSETFQTKLAAMGMAAGETDRAFAAQTQGINAAGFTMQQVRSQVEVLMQKLGDGLAPALMQVLAAVRPLIDKAVELATKFAAMDSGQQALIVKLGLLVVAAGPVLMILGTLAGALGSIISVAGGVGGALAGAGGVAAALVGLLTPVGWAVAAVGVLGVAWARDFGGIRTATGYAVQDISTKVSMLGTSINQSLASGMQSAQAGMRNAWSGLVSMVSDAGSSMRERSSTAGRGVGDALAGGLAGARHGFQGVLSNLASMVNGTFRDRSNDWITAGRNVATGIGTGVANQAGSLYSSMANLGRSLLGSFKSALGIRSPSTEFADAGYDMAWGLALGVDDGSALVYDAIGTMADTSSQMMADAAQAQLVAIADMQKAAAYETSKIDAMIAAGIAKNAAAVTAGMGQDRIIQGFNQAQYAAYWAALQAGESREQAIAKGQQVTGGGAAGSGGAGSGGAAAQAAAAAAAAVAEANKKAEFDAWSARAGDLWSWIGKLGISGLQTAGMDPMGSGKSMTAVLEETLADVAKVLHGGATNDKIPALLTTMQTLIAANATNQVTGLQMAAIPAEMRLQMAGWMDEMSARLDAEKMAAAATAAAAAAAPKIDASLIDTVKNFVARTFGIGAGNLAGDLANAQSMVKQKTWGAFQDAGTYGMDVRGLTAANVFNATQMLSEITESSPVQAIKDALSKLVDFRNLQDDWTQFQSGGFRQSFGDTTRTGNTFNVTFTGSVTDRASVLSDIAFLNGLYGGATP